MRGRVSAVNAMFIRSSNELGGFESGAVAHLFGPVVSVVSGGVGTLLIVLAWTGLFPTLRRVGRLTETAPELETTPLATPHDPSAPADAARSGSPDRPQDHPPLRRFRLSPNLCTTWRYTSPTMNPNRAYWFALIVCSACGAVLAADRDVPDGVSVRDGFELTVAQGELNSPRFLELGPDDTLYVSLPNAGQIKACRDADGDGYYEQVTTYVNGYRSAHGLFYHDGALWFTQSGAVHRASDRDGDGTADEVVTVLDDLPRGGHWWRSILIHNGRLYTSIGDSGNINDETDTDRQKIWSYDLEGGDKTLFISGIRNTEKLVVRPGTDEIWGMDHGSDWFGRPVGDQRGQQPITDYNPVDEMNHYREGEFYGHPFIVGYRLPRYEYTDRDDIIDLADRTVVPEWGMPAHSACNAMCFYTGEQFPDAYRGDAFVTMHGSWNRERKVGYGLARVLFDDGKPYGMLTYVDFLDGQRVLGRPVDVVVAPDGSLLFSDDRGNRIYRLRYTADQP